MKLDFFNKKLANFLTLRNVKATGKKGFTLAELMIVLAVLAIIAAVLMPTVFNSMPDENRLKFKKGYYTLKRTIDAMVNSQEYDDTAGNFGKKEKLAEGETLPWADATNDSDGSKFFCIQFADTLNTVQENCETFIKDLEAGITIEKFNDVTSEKTSTDIDAKCAKFMVEGCSGADCGTNVETQDGIYWALPKDNFTDAHNEDNKSKTITSYSSIPAYYAVLCMDVDGPGETAPFGFAVRRDGKVIAGKHAKEWLQEGTTNTLPDANE